MRWVAFVLFASGCVLDDSQPPSAAPADAAGPEATSACEPLPDWSAERTETDLTVSPAVWGCNPTGGSLGDFWSTAGLVRDLDRAPVAARISFHRSFDEPPSAAVFTSETGTFEVYLPLEPLPLHARVRGAGLLDTFVEHHWPGGPRGIDLEAATPGWRDSIAAATGDPIAPNESVILGIAYDCELPLQRAIVTVTATPGGSCVPPPSPIRVIYLDADGIPDLGASSTITGRFVILGAPAGGPDAPLYLQVWAFPDPSHHEQGAPGLTMVAEHPVWTFPGAVSVVDLWPDPFRPWDPW